MNHPRTFLTESTEEDGFGLFEGFDVATNGADPTEVERLEALRVICTDLTFARRQCSVGATVEVAEPAPAKEFTSLLDMESDSEESLPDLGPPEHVDYTRMRMSWVSPQHRKSSIVRNTLAEPTKYAQNTKTGVVSSETYFSKQRLENFFALYRENRSDLDEEGIEEPVKTARRSFLSGCEKQALAPLPLLPKRCQSSYVDLENYGLGDRATALLTNSLLHAPVQVVVLRLASNGIQKNGAIAIAQAMSHLRFLRHLDLSNNRIGREGSQAIVDVLEQQGSGGHLLSLDLSSNKLGDWFTVHLGEALGDSSLKRLNLSRNDITKDGCSRIGLALKRNTSLRHLDLSWNTVGDRGCVAIANALMANFALTSLNVSWNAIGDEGAAAAADLLESGTSLRRLYLGHNQVGPRGAVAIANSLVGNNTLCILGLEQNPVMRTGFDALTAVMRDAGDLRSVRLDDCVEEGDAYRVSFNPLAPVGRYMCDLSRGHGRRLALCLGAIATAETRRLDEEARLGSRHTRPGNGGILKGTHDEPIVIASRRSSLSSVASGVVGSLSSSVTKTDRNKRRSSLGRTFSPAVGVSVREQFNRLKRVGPRFRAKAEAVLPGKKHSMCDSTLNGNTFTLVRTDLRSALPSEGILEVYLNIPHLPPLSHPSASSLPYVDEVADLMEIRAVMAAREHTHSRTHVQDEAPAPEDSASEADSEGGRSTSTVYDAFNLDPDTQDVGAALETLQRLVNNSYPYLGSIFKQYLEFSFDLLRKDEAYARMYLEAHTVEEMRKVDASLSPEESDALKKRLALYYHFSESNPTGHYRLNLRNAYHRVIALRLLYLGEVERDALMAEESRLSLADPTDFDEAGCGVWVNLVWRRMAMQCQRMSAFRNATWNGNRHVIRANHVLPDEGVLEVDFMISSPIPETARALSFEAFSEFHRDFQMMNNVRLQPSLKTRVAQAAVSEHFFTAKQAHAILSYFKGHYKVELLVSLANRLVDPENFDILLSTCGETLPADLQPLLSESEVAVCCKRLGYMNVICPTKLAGYYELDLSQMDERIVATLLQRLAIANVDETNWRNISYDGLTLPCPVPEWGEQMPFAGLLRLHYVPEATVPNHITLDILEDTYQDYADVLQKGDLELNQNFDNDGSDGSRSDDDGSRCSGGNSTRKVGDAEYDAPTRY
eukprot:Rmarinus@m.14167